MPENLLIHEKSPYLLQHANNPVHWHPWGKEAFDKAKHEDKPVFVSIGYSTCHWCHVMAHESFEDEDVAAILNQHFVSVKVDKEERPDVDSVYMTACQALTGSGGWPLTVLMGADQKPFFIGTYLPKHSRFGQTGLVDLLISVAHQWHSDKQQLLKTGTEFTDLLNAPNEPVNATEPVKDVLKSAVSLFTRMYDSKNGGFGAAPKFPTPHNLLFLMRYAQLEKDSHALLMATQTLTQMARGGIFDHVGGGFSRYSTDQRWLVPHFEKMLYDNALLCLAYSQGYSIGNSPFFKQTLERTLAYALRELLTEEGGFCCGQDADSEGVEGKYYVFTPEETISVLGDAEGPWFNRVYDVSEIGNFESSNIPNLLKYQSYEDAYAESKVLLNKLHRYRKQRTALHRDDKILTSWNALMIVALCDASVTLNDGVYLDAAKLTDDFIRRHLLRDDGKLYLRWRDGEAKFDGHIDDYAFYAWGLLSLYQATLDVAYLLQASKIAEMMLELFFDAENGGFFLYAKDSEQLISRPKEVYDGAIPSGNSVAALVLGRLFKLSGQQEWQQAHALQLRFLASKMQHYPVGQSFALFAFTEALYPSQELVCVSSGKGAFSSAQLIQLYKNPNTTILVKTQQNANILGRFAPWTFHYPIPLEGEQFYLCQNGTCSAPTNDIKEILRQLADSGFNRTPSPA